MNTPSSPGTDPGEYVITFGLHKGETIRQVCKSDVKYLQWLLQQERTSERLYLAAEACEAYIDNGVE